MIRILNINTWNTIPLQMTSVMSRYTNTKTISIGTPNVGKGWKITLYINL